MSANTSHPAPTTSPKVENGDIQQQNTNVGMKRERDDESGDIKPPTAPAAPSTLSTGSDAELHTAINNMKDAFTNALQTTSDSLAMGGGIARGINQYDVLHERTTAAARAVSSSVAVVDTAVAAVQESARARLRVMALITIAQGLMAEQQQLIHMRDAMVNANKRADAVESIED